MNNDNDTSLIRQTILSQADRELHPDLIEDAVAEEAAENAEHDLLHASNLRPLWADSWRWWADRRTWIRWTKTEQGGGWWAPATEEQAATQAVTDLRATYLNHLDEARRNKKNEANIKRWAVALQETCTLYRIRGALSFLKGYRGIHTETSRLDRNPHLFNVLNGTLNLHGVKDTISLEFALEAPNPEHLITRIAPVEYNPQASGEAWKNHLELFIPDPDIRRQIQRDLGTALSAAADRKGLPIWYGTGGNGKSTTAEVLKAILGEYATQAVPNLLIHRKGFEPHLAELAALLGKRLVFSSEIDNQVHLAEAKVKSLTGGDTISARFMRENPRDIPNTWMIVLLCNHHPIISGTDPAIWDRVRLIPWTEKISPELRRPQEDVKRELLAEGPAILHWMLEGYADTLRRPGWIAEAVRAATEEYKAEQDRLSGFLEECCELTPRGLVSVADLYAAYEEWCGREAEEPLKKRTFGEKIRDRKGISSKRTGTERLWMGLKLKTP